MGFRIYDSRFPETKIDQGAIYHELVYFGKNTIIGSNTRIFEDVIIKDNTIVGPNCVIEAGAQIGSNVTIGPLSLITRDAIIEDDVFIGPFLGTTNDKNIPLGHHGTHPDKAVSTNFQPPIIRKGARLGERVTLAPGVVIGESALIDMCSTVTKDVKKGEHVRAGRGIVARKYP